MKKRVQDVFFELLKNSKKSDRDIAKKLKISQPTVTRIRKKLEKNIIKAYTAIPSLSEIDVHIISFNFGRCDRPKKDVEVCLGQMKKSEVRLPFISPGEGMGKSCLIIGFHKDYKGYVEFLSKIREQCKGIKKEFDSFLVPTTKDLFLDFGSPITDLMKRKK